MRKIFSILVVLGLVLGMTVAATPVSAAVTKATVVPVTNCAGQAAVYTITFNISAILHTGSNHIFIEFPEDTAVPAAGWQNGDIQVSDDGGTTWYPVFGLEVEVTGRTVKFMVPIILNPGQVMVRFNTRTGHAIKNPTTPGLYTLKVWTDRPADGTPVVSNAYLISPLNSAYKLLIDFGPEYPGIAPGFIPPVQVCEETSFNLTLLADPIGCLGLPATCDWDLVVTLLGAPSAASKVELVFEGVLYELNLTKPYPAVGFTNQKVLLSGSGLAFNYSETWEMSIHLFDVSWHDLVFEVLTECEVDCGDPLEGGIATLELPIKGLQWLYTHEIDMYAKWNLISLPFEPWNPDIAYQLSSFAAPSLLLSVWHYDQCADTWFGFPDQGLTEIVDGKGYWFRFFYGQLGPLAIPAGMYLGPWWVFGSLESPPTPASYEVCEGWNMIGFTDPTLTGMGDEVYLWNWWSVMNTFPKYGLIYGWDAVAQTFDTGLPGTVTFMPGEGYWVAFQHDGYIYP